MAVTGEQIAQTTLQAIERKGGYIWGQQGATWTAAKQASLEKKYNANPDGMANYKGSVLYGKKWIDHSVWDCAGLCRWAAAQHGVAIHAGSNLIWSCDLAKKGKLTDSMDLPVGALVFTGTDAKKPHIGTYTGSGMVTEAAGAKAGCVQSALHSKWKYWGLVKGVEYTFIPSTGTQQPQTPAAPDTGKQETTMQTIRKGNKGVLVKQMQTMLDKLGYSLGICGVDGDFGVATEKAVKEFQRDHQLAQDGICGPKTWAALQAAVDKIGQAPAEDDRYTVTITGLTKTQAEELSRAWTSATVKKE